MSNLIHVGFWKQKKDSNEDLPWPEIGKYKTEDIEIISNYLLTTKTYQAYRGFSRCRLCGISNGSEEKTDGKYCWPSGLAHYVKEHSIMLPTDFLNHIYDKLKVKVGHSKISGFGLKAF